MNRHIESNVVVGHEIFKDSCLTVHVQFSHEFRVRFWIARKLIKLAGLVLGLPIKEQIEDRDKSDE